MKNYEVDYSSPMDSFLILTMVIGAESAVDAYDKFVEMVEQGHISTSHPEIEIDGEILRIR